MLLALLIIYMPYRWFQNTVSKQTLVCGHHQHKRDGDDEITAAAECVETSQEHDVLQQQRFRENSHVLLRKILSLVSIFVMGLATLLRFMSSANTIAPSVV